MLTRRDFVAAAAAARLQAAEVDRTKFADMALGLAKKSGVAYADIRINRYHRQSIFTRERQVRNIDSDASYGYGVRVLKRGAWGFAASPDFSEKTLAEVVRQAVEIAEANAALGSQTVKLAPEKPHQDQWKSAYKVDPFSVPLDKKVDLLLRINETALQVKGARFVSSAMLFAGENKFFASTEGSVIQQEIVRSEGTFNVTAVDAARGEFASRNSLSYPAQRGYEWIEEYPFVQDAEQAAEEAVQKLKAKPVAPGKYDLLLDPHHLFLTIHESCGHPTELDRALGYEANFAGTSFLTPDKLGKFRYGSKWINMVADRTQPYGLSTVGYDDDGVPAQRWYLIREGIFVDYQTTREQVAWAPGMSSRGCAHGDSWSSVVFQRMPNVSLDPLDSKLTQEELMAGIRNGILIVGNGSFSIDQQRYNFQFGGQVFWEIKNGKKTQMLRDVAYQARTADFWNSCDGVAGKSEYLLPGVFTDAKGEPGQSNPVSHGCPPARFRQVNVINTGRRA
ncbi:MAG: TldD/PmbA family protein [Acidobacteria bacterium]|nr:TldD/PmbA family protein [Acidobacteriota bacterium]